MLYEFLSISFCAHDIKKVDFNNKPPKVKNLVLEIILFLDVPEGPKLLRNTESFHKFCELSSITDIVEEYTFFLYTLYNAIVAETAT